MPLKLTAGVSKKMGLPHYGSLGAICQLEWELDSALIYDPDELQRNVQEAHAACAQAVNDELARQRPVHAGAAAGDPRGPETSSPEASQAVGSKPSAHEGNGQGATDRQREYLRMRAPLAAIDWSDGHLNTAVL